MNLISDETGRRACALMLELAAIPSVTGSDGEEACARFIHDRLARTDYFARHPEDLNFIALENDPLGRHAVAALARAGRPAKKTVILTGHFDVVDVEGCGPLRPWAFDPEEYTRRAGELALSEEARKDLDSGRWLFGRGVSDMKAGVALGICLFEDYISRIGELEFNILLLLVPDEEGDSVGMRGSISHLARLKEEGLDFLACVDIEPVFESNSPAVYYGTIGKIMPLYLCVGIESHAGEYRAGLSSTLIASCLNLSLDGAEDTAETRGNQLFQPQCCLRFRDLRARYAVTLPERTVLYYNCLTVAKTPAKLLEEMKEKALRALEETLGRVRRADLTPRVLTAGEVLDRAALALGCRREELADKLLPRIAAEDERERNIEFLSLALDATGEKGPLVVVGFLPPFYPPRVNENENLRDRAVRAAAAAVRTSLERRGYGFTEIEIFQGITDLSYTGFRGEAGELAPLEENMPLWGRGYGLPLSDLRKIDIPGVVLGPIGKDAHKAAERVELDYAFNVLPSVLTTFIASLSRYGE
ncbi:MAG: M20/M25/M40 family metallo-hydrolase [Synergistaceae bacterium]|nr:M20/M25/M40 family metallo-hydrolase [Synergistaceae bacterium]